jgi:hypothetical protein
MKRSLVALAVISALVVSGCSSTKNKTSAEVREESSAPVKEARISTDFRDQGIKIHYTMTGKLEKIEVYGTAPVWKGNYTVIAEMDAKEKLVKFVHGENVSSDRRMRILGRSLDRAKDDSLVRTESSQSDFSFDAGELERDADLEPNNNDSSSQQRAAQRLERTVVETMTTITASGRLTAVIKVGDQVSRDGRTYIARYEWSEKNQGVAEFMRNRMK